MLGVIKKLNNPQMFLGRSINEFDGYLIGSKIRDTVTALLPFPYGTKALHGYYNIYQKIFLGENLIPVNKTPFTSFTQTKVNEPCIDLMYEDFVLMDKPEVVLNTLNLLGQKYKHMFMTQVNTYDNLIRIINKKNNLTLLLAKGEDVYPSDVNSEDSVVALLYNKNIICFCAVFTNRADIFDCDGEVFSNEYNISKKNLIVITSNLYSFIKDEHSQVKALKNMTIRYFSNSVDSTLMENVISPNLLDTNG